MQTYRLRPEGIRAMQRQLLFRSVLTSLIAIGAAFWIVTQTGNGEESAPEVLRLVIPMLLLFTGIGILRRRKQQRQLLESYRLIIGPDYLERQQASLAPVIIPAAGIRSLTRNADGSLVVRGTAAGAVIGIPAQVEDYPALEQQLQALSPVPLTAGGPSWTRYGWLAALPVIGLMVAFYTVQHKGVIAVTGTLLAGFLLWSLLVIQRSREIDRKTKRLSWIVLLVLLSVAGSMLIRLTGFGMP
jgi:hypothetical protein